jgi:hypothetical protein
VWAANSPHVVLGVCMREVEAERRLLQASHFSGTSSAGLIRISCYAWCETVKVAVVALRQFRRKKRKRFSKQRGDGWGTPA